MCGHDGLSVVALWCAWWPNPRSVVEQKVFGGQSPKGFGQTRCVISRACLWCFAAVVVLVALVVRGAVRGVV